MQKQTLVQEECAMCLYINKWPNPALGHCSAAAHGEIAWARGKQPGQRELICLHHLQGTQGEVPGTARVHIQGQTGGWAWIRAQEPGKQNSELAQARGAVSGELQDTCIAHSQCSSAGHCSVHPPLLPLLWQGLLCVTFQQ